MKVVRGKEGDGVPALGETVLQGRRASDTRAVSDEPDANGDTMLPALDGEASDYSLPNMANPSHMAQLDQEIALAQVEGGIKASSLKRIGETISNSPAESASVIRQWMNA